MQDVENLLLAAFEKLVTEHYTLDEIRRARGGSWLERGWAAIVDMGLPLALVSQDRDGFGLPSQIAFAVARLAAENAIDAPVAETMLANRRFGEAGLALACEPIALVPVEAGIRIASTNSGHTLRGSAPRVADGRHVAGFAVEALDDAGELWVAHVPTQVVTIAANGLNIASMARDAVSFDCDLDRELAAPGGDPLMQLEGATLRASQCVGALGAALRLTLGHVGQRRQFGQSLASFQAVQQEMARFAAQVASATGAADLAVNALPDRAIADLAVAAARLRIGEATGFAAAVAHQLHGAIGFTQEHPLHLFTSCALAWRDEFGLHREWARLLGRRALSAGPAGYWPLVTAIQA
jgi:acyl-CoA dehydrogenase